MAKSGDVRVAARCSVPGTRRGLLCVTAAALAALLTAPGNASSSHESARPMTLPLIELRQYVLYPGKRDVLIDMFERNFIEPQEAAGMTIVGTFREPEHPSHFVWLRGFTDMESRAKGLHDFYSGPVWQANRAIANPLLEDNDNVLLLREAAPGSGFAPDATPRPPMGATALPGGLIVATIYYLKAPPRDGFTDFFARDMAPALKAADIPLLASFVPETSPNNFPTLKIREGENLFVWFSKFKDRAAYEEHLAAFARMPVQAALTAQLASPPEILKLEPTARSRLHD